ncbi:uncharacterized protein LOC127786831 [Diospyros lotus]|uniref:uncharacterized protein LOC127786831 n=1 Tax=Diospyros lotus TaxID=55363 RepID=UPI002259D88C|nr:uncharacterized protein LOC127786831 [Diospyros lotus]
MKSRSHRLPTTDPPDDWVDGSWTVDCVCGVNFDDGEEMVNCDECGVWVHTRCSRYVKSEKSFACDKCKSKKTRNESEETEVAQLLVELPTKTLRMDNPYPSSGPPRRPFRLWTDMPMQERVHVQGIPGGDPALFVGLQSVFTPQLWKCTGYVPKKFNFQYREFPCWDKEKDYNGRIDEENENPVDKGAGVLFSLSKENVVATPVTTLIDMKGKVEESGCELLPPQKDMKKWEGEHVDASYPPNSVKKDRTLIRPFVLHSNKHKKEESCSSKDRSGKKKVRVVDREGDPKTRAPQASKTASVLPSDANQLELYEDGSPKIVQSDTQSTRNMDMEDTLPNDTLLRDHHFMENNADKPKDSIASSVKPSETLASDAPGHTFSISPRPMEKAGCQVSGSTESLSKFDDHTALLEHNDQRIVPIKEEVGMFPDDNVNDNKGSLATAGIDLRKTEPVVEDFSTSVAEANDNQNGQDSSVGMCPRLLEPVADVKKEADLDNLGGNINVDSSTSSDMRSDGLRPLNQLSGASADHLSANVKTNDTTVTSSLSSDPKVHNVDKCTEVVSNCQTQMAVEFPHDACQSKQQMDRPEASITVRKSSSQLKNEAAEEPPKLSSVIVISSTPHGQRKSAASSSTSSTIVTSKSSISDNPKHPNAQNCSNTAKRGIFDCGVSSKKDNNSSDTVRYEDRHQMSRKMLKERSKCSVSSALKVSHSSKASPASDSKKTLSDHRDSVTYSSSKTSSSENIGVNPVSGDLDSSKTLNVSHVQHKSSASGLPQRNEKVTQSNSQSSIKLNHTPSHPPALSNSPATLSDEELALLLHQELNSSPRVPRVPRMRHTGSLPQLGSPTATSMLVKRTSSSGGRDHTFTRRKNKDLPKDGPRSSREVDDEAKTDRLMPSPDLRKRDGACSSDAFMKREVDNGSKKGVHVVKSAPSVTTATLSSGPSSSTEANEQNFSSMHNSPQNASDDDTGTVGGPVNHTLPGLIAEIMSKGKRMTYEELCNAVLPHWPNLRKHNGERYAYSSHSQAVLDCLRNRQEWAQLVDRGPKTNAGRKKRKTDIEAPSFELEDNEYGKGVRGKEVDSSKNFESHQEEFPKGKRKARKRRRLALQGRGIKDVRRQRKADMLSDDDLGSFSSSSEESTFSDDEIDGGETVPDGSEASTSSDEAGAVS